MYNKWTAIFNKSILFPAIFSPFFHKIFFIELLFLKHHFTRSVAFPLHKDLGHFFKFLMHGHKISFLLVPFNYHFIFSLLIIQKHDMIYFDKEGNKDILVFEFKLEARVMIIFRDFLLNFKLEIIKGVHFMHMLKS